MSTQPSSIIVGQRIGTMRDEPAESDLQQTIGKVLAILRHRRWLFVLPLLLGILATLVVSLFLPKRFSLRTIFERRDDVVLTKLITSNSPYSFETLRRSLTINLIGYNALDEALEKIEYDGKFCHDENGKLTRDAQLKRQVLISGLMKDLKVSLLETSPSLDLIELRYTGSDPDLGTKLVRQLKDNYIATTHVAILDVLNKSQEFFAAEVGKRKEDSAKLQAELLDFIALHPGVDPANPDQLEQLLTTEKAALEDLNRRREENVSKATAMRDYLILLDNQQKATTQPASSETASVMTMPDPRRQRLEGLMEHIRSEIAQAKTVQQMTEQHPLIIGLRRKLEQTRVEFEQLPETFLGPAITTPDAVSNNPFDSQRARAEAELKSQNEIIARLDRDIEKHRSLKEKWEQEKNGLFERRQNFMVRQQELTNIKADLKTWEDHLSKVQEVMVASAEQRGIQFATVEEAQQTRIPNSPTVAGIFLLSGGIGLMLAVAAVFLREVLDQSFRNPARVRQVLGIPVLETIGEIPSSNSTGWFSRRRLLPVVAATELAAIMVVSVLVVIVLQYPTIYDRCVTYMASLGTS